MKNKRKIYVVVSVALLVVVGALSYLGGNGAFQGNLGLIARAPLVANEPVITRAEFAALLVRELDLPAAPVCNIFVDVPQNVWYNGPICSLAQSGIMKGFPDATFRPMALLTRAEAASYIHDAFNVSYKCPLPKLFTDVDPNVWNKPWYAVAVNDLAGLSVFVTETQFGTNFRPNDSLTRVAVQKWFSELGNVR